MSVFWNLNNYPKQEDIIQHSRFDGSPINMQYIEFMHMSISNCQRDVC